MKRISSVVAIFFALCLALGMAAFGARTEAAAVAVYDNAKLLSTAEKEKLTQKIRAIEQQYSVKIGIVTLPTLQGRPVGQMANAILDENYRGAANGGIVLLLSMKERDWYVATDNAMRERVTDKEGFKYIEKEMVSKLKDGKYGAGFENYVNAVETMVAYYAKEGKPYDPSAGFHPFAAIAALIIGLLGGYGVRSSLIASMSNVTPAARASEYLKEGSFDLTESDDRFLFMDVTRTAKSKGGGSHDATDSDHGGGGGKF